MPDGRVFRDNFHQCDCPKKLRVQDLEIAWGELGREGGTLNSLKLRVFGTGFSGQIPSMRLSRTSVRLRFVKLMPNPGQWDTHGKKFVAGEFFLCTRRWTGAWPGLARSTEQH